MKIEDRGRGSSAGRGGARDPGAKVGTDGELDDLRVGPGWDLDSFLDDDRQPRRRASPRKLALLADLLPEDARDQLRELQRASRPPSDVPARVVSGARGRLSVDWGGIRIGTRRRPRAVPEFSGRGHGFGSVLGRARHRDERLDRVLSMRAPWHPGVPLQAAILRCDDDRPWDADEIAIPVFRASMDTPQMRERAEERAPDAFWVFHSGQGGGLLSLGVPIQAAVAARLVRRLVDIRAVASDRLLRTGTYLATRVLGAAGGRVDCSEDCVDRPHHDGLWRTAERFERDASRLASRLGDWARDLLSPPPFADGEILDPPISPADRRLPGVVESLATGSGLDWLMRADAARQGLARGRIGDLIGLPSWRPTKGTDGYWLMAPGYRERMDLRTVLRPVLIRGYQDACMALIRARWPFAEFLEPVIVRPTASDIGNGEKNVRLLERLRLEVLVAVDHTQIHWGSVLDLDLFLRQRGCHLSTVFASTYAAPNFAIRVLDRL